MEDSQKIQLFILTVKELSGVDFSGYSSKSFLRRLEKLEQDFNLDLEEIVYKLKSGRINVNKIIEQIVVNTTELFRDTQMWVDLFNVLSKKQIKDSIDILHLGVSSGEELYSAKILLTEMGFKKINSIGVDLNKSILEVAEEAVYKNNIIADYMGNYNNLRESLSDKIKMSDITKYVKYKKSKDIIKILPQYKKNTAFFEDDIITSDITKYGKFDIVMCRNILIYFDIDIQNKILSKIYKVLKNRGLLILGAHEGIYSPLSSKFELINNIYIKE